jgi:hypothetical protein
VVIDIICILQIVGWFLRGVVSVGTECVRPLTTYFSAGVV